MWTSKGCELIITSCSDEEALQALDHQVEAGVLLSHKGTCMQLLEGMIM